MPQPRPSTASPPSLRRQVVVVGAKGMLGSTWRAALERTPLADPADPTAPPLANRFLDLPDFDLRSEERVAQAIDERAALVINCAGYTDVDAAELNPDAAFEINARAVESLARRCAQTGALLVHYSTDYVFDGQRDTPYPADHPVNPLNNYGRSKAAGEAAVLASGAAALLIRTSWLFAPTGRNFVRTIADLCKRRSALRVVDDQRGRPTSTAHLVDATRKLLEAGARGLFHVSLQGQCSWFEYAKEIVLSENAGCVVEPCSSDEYPLPAPRPRYSALDLSATEALIGPAPHWKDELRRILPLLAASTQSRSD